MDIKYTIFDYSEVDKINFNETLYTSKESLRLSVDGTKTFIKWSGYPPECLNNVVSKSQPFTNLEMLLITSYPEWTQSESISVSGTT